MDLQLTMQTGEIGRLANGAVTARQGNTVSAAVPLQLDTHKCRPSDDENGADRFFFRWCTPQLALGRRLLAISCPSAYHMQSALVLQGGPGVLEHALLHRWPSLNSCCQRSTCTDLLYGSQQHDICLTVTHTA